MQNTAQKCRLGLLAFLAAWLCLIALAPAAFAASSATLSIPVKCSTATGAYLLELSAASNTTPMPNGNQGGTTQRACNGGSSVSFGPISYSAPGDYYYTLRQVPGTDPNVKYDGTVYELRAFAYYDDSGNLTVKLAASRSGCDGKVSELVFDNARTGSPQTGDGTNLAFPTIAALASAGTLVCVGRKNRK
jgi:pilin isopeptide linkage protein